MTLNRRDALKILGHGGATATVACAGAGTAQASTTPATAPEGAVAMLYDATICTGCKACVVACSDANELPPDTTLSNGLWQMPPDLNSETKNIIKLWQGASPDEFSYVKRQCMHCVDPACVAGCPFEALTKDPVKGVVGWNGDRCIGCRYCEVACPFEVPKFEWDRFNPQIVKCEFCDHRLAVGKEPGCTEVCPTGAVIFGKREDLLRDAKGRIADQPGHYFEDRVYGEHEAGGTQVLYLSSVPFEDIGLPKLAHRSLAHYGTWVHGILYNWLAIPLALYALLVGIIMKRWKHHEHEAGKERAEGLPPQL